MLKTHRCNEFGMEREMYYGEMNFASFYCMMSDRYDYSSDAVILYNYAYCRHSPIF
jgi:hypothetical protein